MNSVHLVTQETTESNRAKNRPSAPSAQPIGPAARPGRAQAAQPAVPCAPAAPRVPAARPCRPPAARAACRAPMQLACPASACLARTARPLTLRAQRPAPVCLLAPRPRTPRAPCAPSLSHNSTCAVAIPTVSASNFFFLIFHYKYFFFSRNWKKSLKSLKINLFNPLFLKVPPNKFIKIYSSNFLQLRKFIYFFHFLFQFLYSIHLDIFSTHLCANHQAHIILCYQPSISLIKIPIT